METTKRKSNKPLRKNEFLPGKSTSLHSSLAIEECSTSVLGFTVIITFFENHEFQMTLPHKNSRIIIRKSANK